MKNDRITRLLKLLCLLATIVLVIFVYVKERKEEFLFCQDCRTTKALEIHDIVSSINKPKKGVEGISFRNGLRLSATYVVIFVDNYISVGDSIFKPAGQFKYYIYKNGNKDNCIVLEREYDCSYECEDCILYQEIKDRVIQSVVKAVGDGRIMFSDNYLLHRDYTGEKIEDYVSVGDSIYKPSGLFKYYIYKQGNKDNPVIVEGDCGCDD